MPGTNLGATIKRRAGKRRAGKRRAENWRAGKKAYLIKKA
jgi:hypothetical protein